jgi:hypothetical protein
MDFEPIKGEYAWLHVFIDDSKEEGVKKELNF